MRLTRLAGSVLEVATWWPIVYMGLFFGAWLTLMGLMTSSPGPEAGQQIEWIFTVILPMHLLTMVSMFGLLGMYVFLVWKNPDHETTHKLLWTILFFVASPFGMLIYLYREVKPQIR